MGKANRATRKELEEVVGNIIQELQYLRQGFTALDNYVGAYVKYKGDAIEFNSFLMKEYEKAQEDGPEIKTSKTKESVKSDKKSRYKKVSTPPL
jgi:hypothetical protein|tara:strand:- start:476 stop:757 length:282 start_codon:yes stop_codon:yes gene_type:complete